MKIKLYLLFTLMFSFVFSQQKEENKPNKSIVDHYNNVLNTAVTLGDLHLQNEALINLYAETQNDFTLVKLTENYLIQKEYAKAYKAAEMIKDTLGIGVRDVKAWTYKMNNMPKKSNYYFNQILEKNPSPDIAFQIAVNNMEMNKIQEAKKLIETYKPKSNKDMKVNTTDKISYYKTSLLAAWENLEGMVAYMETKGDLNIIKARKKEILKHFDEAIALDPMFTLAKENKEGIEKLVNK